MGAEGTGFWLHSADPFRCSHGFPSLMKGAGKADLSCFSCPFRVLEEDITYTPIVFLGGAVGCTRVGAPPATPPKNDVTLK